MKFYFSFILLSAMIIAGDVLQKDIDCSVYRKGTFIYRIKRPGGGILIERNDSLQVETDKKLRTITYRKIKWTGDCEYELTYYSGRDMDTMAGGQITVYEAKNPKPQKYKIVEAAKEYYVFETNTGRGGIYKDTLWSGARPNL